MKTIDQKQSQYRNLKFKTEEEFDKWLMDTYTSEISFKDKGQDLQTIYTDAKGEILHANLQTSIWCGEFVNLKELKKNKPIQMWDNHNGCWKKMNGLIVE